MARPPSSRARRPNATRSKIKDGADNQEVYGEVAGSRLLWTLGVPGQLLYPVSVTCHRCPDDPHRDPRPSDHDMTFDVAALERPMDGRKIETRPDQGWEWAELNLVKEAAGGATVEQRDALKLLAVFMQHSDSKPEQQRLICRDGGATEPCPSPFMYLHDVGLTLGKASLFNTAGKSSASFDNWTKATIWKDRERCITRPSAVNDRYLGRSGGSRSRPAGSSRTC